MEPECVLIRIGEQSLKSEQVMRIFDRILLKNIRVSLHGLKYELKREPNRYFIYTDNIDKATDRLKRVFGVTSVSPCYICRSEIDEMKKLAKAIFKPGKKKFAIRARRSGSHQFTSQDIASKVGYVIPGSVDLSNPQAELFIECRQVKTYMFTEKIAGPGGLPLGASGKVFGLLNDEDDLVACWLLMKRGCEIEVVSSKKSLIDDLRKWHTGSEMRVLTKMPKKHDITGIVMGEKTYASMKKKPTLLILRPLVGFDRARISGFLTLISE